MLPTRLRFAGHYLSAIQNCLHPANRTSVRLLDNSRQTSKTRKHFTQSSRSSCPLYRMAGCCIISSIVGRDGITHVVFERLEFVAKLAALVFPPRFNQVRYHGIQAPAAGWRSSIVPLASAAAPDAADPVAHDGCSAGKQSSHDEKSAPSLPSTQLYLG